MKVGLDLEMPGSFGANDKMIKGAVLSGELEESVLDAAVVNILNIVFRYEENRDKNAVFDKDKDHETARKVAEETIVLLNFETEGSLDVTGNDMVVTIRFENMDVSLSQDFALFIYEYLESWDDSYADIVSDLDTIVNEPGACTYTLRFTDPDNVVFAEKTYSNR